MDQREAAAAVMEEWLSHPQELGKKPAKLEIAGEFDLHDLHYYIFKYKKSFLGPWLVAVCGGYEGDGLGHCGHIFSEMERYDPATAQDKCVAMVEKIRQYWMDRAKQEEEKERSGGDFLGFVLLSSPELDAERFRAAIQAEWGIDWPPEERPDPEKGPALVLEQDGMMATVGLMEAPVPDGEAEYWANSNFLSRDKAVTAAKAHKAHLLVAVLGRDGDPIRAGELFVKIASTCLKAPNALGLYARNTVWLPEQYLRAAEPLKRGEFPLTGLVFIGLYQNEKGVSAWTSGLCAFGKEELEVINSGHSPQEVYGLLANLSGYLIEQGAVFHTGETVGYTADQKLPLTLSDGVALEGQTMKIGF